MNLENMTKIYARGDSRIQLKVIPGHFVTSQSHITHYLDLTTMKSRTAEAQNIAHELAANYEVSTPVDTIICMDGLEVIGAYLSEELTKAGIFSLNAHQTIYVITPESSNSGQIIFRDNFQPMIKGKKCTDPQWFDYHRLYFVQSNREHSVLRRHYQRYRSHIQQSRQRGFSPCIFYF